MIKKLARRHRLVILPLLLVMTGFIVPLHIGQPDGDTVVAPAQVVVTRADAIDQGVRIEWLESQAGTHPVSGYVIERERDESVITVARVEKISRYYIDAEGKTGDTYRIIVEDDQRSARRSATSEPVVAGPVRPGGAVLAASTKPMPASLLQAPTADAKAAVLQTLIAQSFIDFDNALSQKSIQATREQLAALHAYQQAALFLLSGLSEDKKSLLANVCIEHLSIFETNLHILSEQDHMDGMLVLAACNALQESAQ